MCSRARVFFSLTLIWIVNVKPFNCAANFHVQTHINKWVSAFAEIGTVKQNIYWYIQWHLTILVVIRFNDFFLDSFFLDLFHCSSVMNEWLNICLIICWFGLVFSIQKWNQIENCYNLKKRRVLHRHITAYTWTLTWRKRILWMVLSNCYNVQCFIQYLIVLSKVCLCECVCVCLLRS